VRDDGDAAGRVDGRDRVRRVHGLGGDERRAAVAQVALERRLGVGDVAAADEGARDVRPGDHIAGGLGADLVHGERAAELGEAVEDAWVADVAVAADLG
jgi:hypothetical protein